MNKCGCASGNISICEMDQDCDGHGDGVQSWGLIPMTGEKLIRKRSIDKTDVENQQKKRGSMG